MSLQNKIRHSISCFLPYGARKWIEDRLSSYRQKKANSVEARLAELRELIIFNHPITQVPQATGKLLNVRKGVVFTRGLVNVTDEELKEKIKKEIYNQEEPLPEEENPLLFLSPSAAFLKDRIFRHEDVFPLKTADFEGDMHSVPAHSRQYLEMLYDDYMTYLPKLVSGTKTWRIWSKT